MTRSAPPRPRPLPAPGTGTSWYDVRRQFLRKGTLSPERVARLDSIGFEWEKAGLGGQPIEVWRQQRWGEFFQRLVAFKERFGHVQVPQRWSEDRELATWVADQRKSGVKNHIIPERREQLEAIGFCWVVTQRNSRRDLEALGFTWGNPTCQGMSAQESYDHAWSLQLAKLRAYRQRFGHARVPVSWAEDRHLVHWVEKQRKAGRENRLSPERRRQLDDLGFVWKPDHTTVFKPRPDQRIPKAAHNAIWDQHYAALRAWQQKHGPRLPTTASDKAMSLWCRWQRKKRREGALDPRRIDLLDAIAFPWTVSASGQT